MSRASWWILALILGIMGGIALWQHTRSSMPVYTSLTSQQLHVRFEYPEGWKVHEVTKPMRGEVGEVQIFGPRREDLKYSLYLDVKAESVNSPTGEPPPLEQALKAALAERQHLPSYHVLEQQATRCAGQPAARILASYQLALPLQAAMRKSVEFRELVVYCVQRGWLFSLTYAAPAENFEQHQHAFEHLVKSVSFLH